MSLGTYLYTMCLYSSLTKPGLFDHDQEIVIRSIFEAHTKIALYSLSPGTKLMCT